MATPWLGEPGTIIFLLFGFSEVVTRTCAQWALEFSELEVSDFYMSSVSPLSVISEVNDSRYEPSELMLSEHQIWSSVSSSYNLSEATSQRVLRNSVSSVSHSSVSFMHRNLQGVNFPPWFMVQ